MDGCKLPGRSEIRMKKTRKRWLRIFTCTRGEENGQSGGEERIKGRFSSSASSSSKYECYEINERSFLTGRLFFSDSFGFPSNLCV
jgi:hypothetical protein